MLIIIVYIIINLILLPLAYIKVIFVTGQQVINHRIDVSLKLKVLKFFLYLFFGIFILLLGLCSDIGAFVIH